MWRRGVLLVSLALIALGSTTKCPKRRTSPAREILCYTSTFDVQRLADSVCSCTTLVHENHDVRNLSISDIADLRKSLREMHPPLQFVISIHDSARTLRTSAMSRQEAIARIITVVKEVDGVELNVTAGSKERLYNFVKSLKDEMIRKSYDKRILMALPSKPEDLAKQFDLKELVKYIDLFTLPTDYLTDEDGDFVTFHPSRLMGLFDMLNTDNLVDLLSELGAPKRQILISLPASAYKFNLKNETENSPRSETTEKEPIPIDRKELCETMNGGEWTVERDEDLTAPYAFQNKTWISFEDKISVGIKGKYALLRDLAGLAVRSVENDLKTECEKPLTQEIYQSFTEFQRKSRQAVLNALEDELHQAQFSYPNQARTSNYRMARVVDKEGHIRAVRQSTQTEFVCRRQGYFVHPKSCNRFYRCVKFNQAVEDYSVFEFDCPAGLSFDERTEVCVWPGSLPQGSPCPGSSEIAPVTPKRFECPSEPGYYADPQNCRWFFACMDLGESHLMAFEFRCPYGLVFDENKLVCEWPWLVPACSESGSAYARTEYNYGGYSGGTTAGIGVGGYVTGALPEYSVRAGADYSGIDYSRTTGAGIHETDRVNYYGSTTDRAGTISGHGFSGPGGVGYSGSTGGYEGSVSSVPTYSGSPDIQGVSAGYSTSSGGISSTSRAGIGYTGYDGGVNTAYTGAYGRVPADISGSTAGGYTASVSGGNTVAEGAGYSRTPETSYFGSTSDVRVGPTGSTYAGSSGQYTGSGTINTDGYSASTGIYSGITGHQPSSGPSFGTVSPSYPGVEITGSINRGYTGSTADVYRGSTVEGYSTASSGIESNLQGSTSSGNIQETNFISGASKPEFVTPGISIIPGRAGATGASSTGVRYNGEEGGYTVPVFIQPEQPIYPSIGTTGTGVRDFTGTPGTIGVSVSSDYGRIDTARPGLNISVYGDRVPTTYDVQAGTTGSIQTGSSVEGGILTGDSYSGTVVSHGGIPGSVTTAAIDQGTIITGGAQPGYVSTSSGTPGYVIRDGVKTVEVESASPGTVLYGTPTPAVTLTGPSTPSVIIKGDVTPGVVISGHTAPGVSIGGSIQPGTVVGSTGRPYVSQSSVSTYSGISDATRGSAVYPSSTLSGGLTSPQGYETDRERNRINIPYYDSKFTENDILDYRPTSATAPDSIVSGGRIDGAGGVILGSTLAGVQDSSTVAPGYSPSKPSGFTPSGFTKTGPTRTGITTAVLSGGGSYTVSPSERRPVSNPENIGEKAFEGNVAGYTKTSYSNVGLASTLIPPGYSTVAPGSRPQSITSGYTYPKPTVQFETSGATSTISPIEGNLPVTTSTPFLNVEVHNVSPDSNVFGLKIPTETAAIPDYNLPTTTLRPRIHTTEHPDIYKTTLFEAAKIPVSTSKPFIDNGYKTVSTDRFTQRIDGSYTASLSTSSIDLGIPFQQTTSSGQKDYGSFTSSSPALEYLPGESSKPGLITTTGKYDASAVTVRPELGVTYKKPSTVSGITYDPSSIISPTTYRPSNIYYSNQGFSTTSSSGTTLRGGSPTNLDISRGEIDKLITNYDRGTIKHTPSVYDTFGSTGFGNTFKTPISGPTTLTYEVTTKSPEGKGKVIVKWSDLHPLLLGKLGAECTCKADPFATLRGPVRKLIDSSKGKVDLANYDESEIYVDLENDEGSSEEGDYISTYDNLSPQPYKISGPLGDTMNSINLPSASYLPVSSTTISTTNYLPPDVRTGVSARNDIRGRSSGFQVGVRNAKKLKDNGPSSPNSIASDEEEDPDQIIDGATDCARPGLFRHPNFCNKFYACHWDQWKKKFTLHIFNCPIHLTFDSKAGACNWPSKGPACQAGNLLV